MCNWRFPSFPSSELNLNFEFLEIKYSLLFFVTNKPQYFRECLYIYFNNKQKFHNHEIKPSIPSFYRNFKITPRVYPVAFLSNFQTLNSLLATGEKKRKLSFLFIFSHHISFRFLLICTHTRTHGSWKYLQRKLTVASSHRQRKRLPKA